MKDNDVISKEVFKEVYKRLIKIPRGNNRKSLNETISLFYLAGWTTKDIASYCNCTEEVNPRLKEEYALRKMQAIVERVGINPYGPLKTRVDNPSH